MGTFGLGGLHRKSTWLHPVATFAVLPPQAVDGSVCITLDTNLAWQYDATIPGWIPFVGSGVTGIKVRESDGVPTIDPTKIITVPSDSLTVGGTPDEAVLSYNNYTLREVVIGPFTGKMAAGTVLNIQTGVYAGPGSPAALTGDLNVTLPAAGVTFKDDGRIEVLLNGQDLTKGDGTGNGIAEWVSATQIKIGIDVKIFGELIVRAPYPTA